MSTLAIICAMALNRVIGRNNQLPWHLPADLQYFKKTTLGKPIIMGRKTYDSIGRPLPGRSNIVVTRQANFRAEGVHVARSLHQAMEIAEHHSANSGEYFVIGGAELYQQALAFAQRLYLTQIEAYVEGDAYFPEFDTSAWQLLSEHHHPADSTNVLPLSFKIFEPALNI